MPISIRTDLVAGNRSSRAPIVPVFIVVRASIVLPATCRRNALSFVLPQVPMSDTVVSTASNSSQSKA
jgi:hypothetical protein